LGPGREGRAGVKIVEDWGIGSLKAGVFFKEED
jgi:hypothetical protein